jgi:hypothetical protein
MLIGLSILALGIGIYAATTFSADAGVARPNDFPGGFAYNPVDPKTFDPSK